MGVVARLPVLPIRIGAAIGFLVAGLGALIAVVATADRPAATFARALGECVVIGGVMWLLQRGRESWRRQGLDPAMRPTAYLRWPALARGILGAVCAAAVGAVVMGLLVWAWGGDASDAGFVVALWLGFGASAALSARDLRRWQELNGLDVFTNGAGPRFAYTRSQAVRQVVLVERRAVVLGAGRQPDPTP